MTIYFSGSITGGRDDVALYRQFIAAFEAAGHRVLSGAVGDAAVSAGGEGGNARAIYDRDLAWIRECNLLVAEVSVPSHGVGYEIAAARHLFAKPVVALTRRRCSAMIAGDPEIRLLEYTSKTVADAAASVLRITAEIEAEQGGLRAVARLDGA